MDDCQDIVLTYSVKEIFYTLQGEGARSGRPAVFCRFSGCNLWSGREADRSRSVCRFCDTDFVGTDGVNGGKFAQAEDLSSFIESLWPAGFMESRYVVFTGGEPLVRKDDLIKLCKKHKECAFLAFTNGTLVDEAFCQEMLNVGNLYLAISLEGFEAVNDLRRGQGVYGKVMHTMELLKSHGLVFGTSICYTSKNIETVTSDEFVDLMIENGCRYALYFHYMPVGNDASLDLLPTPEQRIYMKDRVREIRNMTTGKGIFTMDFQNDGEFVGGCIAGGRNYFHINANGDAEPCVFIHYSGANIRENTLLEILKQPLFMAYHDNQPFNENPLRPCPMLENPDILQRLVKETGAKSTDLQSPESAEHLCEKCRDYAEKWKPCAEKLWAESKKSR